MTYWSVSVIGDESLPSSAAGIDFGPRLLEEADGVKLESFSAVPGPQGINLSLDFRVAADSEEEAREKLFAWLEGVCVNGTWIQEGGLTVDFDSEDGNADFTDIHDMFWINGISSEKDGEG